MRKGIQGIDFLGGLVLFMSIVIYIAFSAINTSINYDSAIHDNTLHQEAWMHSEKIVHDITDESNVVNEAKLAYFAACSQEDVVRYKEIQSRLGMDFDNTFRMTMSHHPIGLAERPEGDNYAGNLVLESTYPITFVKESGVYPKVIIQGTTYDDDPSTATPTTVTLEGTTYTVERIERGGQYVILSSKTTCGLSPSTQRTVVVTDRYLVKDNQMFKLRFEYW